MACAPWQSSRTLCWRATGGPRACRCTRHPTAASGAWWGSCTACRRTRGAATPSSRTTRASQTRPSSAACCCCRSRLGRSSSACWTRCTRGSSPALMTATNTMSEAVRLWAVRSRSGMAIRTVGSSKMQERAFGRVWGSGWASSCRGACRRSVLLCGGSGAGGHSVCVCVCVRVVCVLCASGRAGSTAARQACHAWQPCIRQAAAAPQRVCAGCTPWVHAWSYRIACMQRAGWSVQPPRPDAPVGPRTALVMSQHCLHVHMCCAPCMPHVRALGLTCAFHGKHSDPHGWLVAAAKLVQGPVQ